MSQPGKQDSRSKNKQNYIFVLKGHHRSQRPGPESALPVLYLANLPSFMLNKPHQTTQNNLQTQEPAQSTPTTDFQHGSQHDSFCLILDIPAEILAGVTSHLDPPSLQSLGLVNKRLSDHIKDDGTWHRAFVQQILGIDFQSELHDSHKRLLLRREAKTWKQEFITRFNLCK